MSEKDIREFSDYEIMAELERRGHLFPISSHLCGVAEEVDCQIKERRSGYPYSEDERDAAAERAVVALMSDRILYRRMQEEWDDAVWSAVDRALGAIELGEEGGAR